MEYHEQLALTAFGLDHNLDTTGWDIKAIPAAHLFAFRLWAKVRYFSALERLSEPDDPGDQAWWHERCNEWYDILITLREQK